MRWLVSAIFICLINAGISTAVIPEDALISRIAFGSCSNQSAPQPIWNAIIDFSPDLFIWMGDNIYGDAKRPFRLFGQERTIGPWKNVPRFYPTSEDEMSSRYQKAKNNPGYSRLRNMSKVIGTWDDHDYGLNDAGKEFSMKDTNQRLMLDFLDEPVDSPRRKQAGVYTSYTFGPEGRQIKVIILDTRYHRDPLSSDGTILGSSQWAWLQKEMHGSPTAITVIVSSIQVLSNISATTAPFIQTECWSRFPKERSRLFQLIADTKRDGMLFISGDVHYGEIARYDCATGYPLYDITSSGLTQSVEGTLPSPLRLVVRFLAWITPTTVRVKTHNCRFKSCTYGQPNFGAIRINWSASPVTLEVELRDAKGSAVIGVNMSLSDLQAGKLPLAQAGDFGKYWCTREADLPWIVRYRLAILVFNTLAVLLLMTIGIAYAAVVISRRWIRKCKHD
ncbi:hypothetical protein AKJ16_DCAP06466 [Drosera capensis]